MDNKSCYWQCLFPLPSHVPVPWGSSSDSHSAISLKEDSSAMLTSDLTSKLPQFNNPLEVNAVMIIWSLRVWHPATLSDRWARDVRVWCPALPRELQSMVLELQHLVTPKTAVSSAHKVRAECEPCRLCCMWTSLESCFRKIKKDGEMGQQMIKSSHFSMYHLIPEAFSVRTGRVCLYPFLNQKIINRVYYVHCFRTCDPCESCLLASV